MLLMVCIALASLTPLPELPAPGSDKLHHFIAYGLLALPVSLVSPKSLWYWLVIFVVFGGAIELVQPYVNRYGEWFDWVANIGGIFIGFFLARMTRIVILK